MYTFVLIFATVLSLGISAERIGVCPEKDGAYPAYLPDLDCTKFWECSNGIPNLLNCLSGLHFNPRLNVCDWPDRAGCSILNNTRVNNNTITVSENKLNSRDGCPEKDGRYPVYLSDPNCTKFWECSNGVPYPQECPSGLHFNPRLNICDWPNRARCSTTSADLEPTNVVLEDHKEFEVQQDGFACPEKDGRYPVYLPDIECAQFWECSNGIPHLQPCPPGLHFNPKLNVCDWPNKAGCLAKKIEAIFERNSDVKETEDENNSGPCPEKDGAYPVYIPDVDCTKFWECSNGQPFPQWCPPGLHFNPKLNVCDWPEQAGCNSDIPA